MGRTERTYYLVYGLYSLSWAFIGPMYTLFLLSRGLDLFQVSLVPAVFWITAAFLEVPTGAFADVAGRKRAFLLSCVFRMLAFALYAFAAGFGEFLIAEFIDAVGATLANGALEAWAVDALRSEGKAGGTDRFFARAQIVARTAIIASGLAGGYAAQRDMSLPWLLAAASFTVTGGVALLVMREPRRAAAAPRPVRRSLPSTVREGLGTVRHTPVLLLLCSLTLATTFATMPAYTYWQPRMQALTGEGTWLMGWIWVLINMASIAGSALILRFVGRSSRALLLGAVTVWRGVTLGCAAAATSFVPALAGFLLAEMGFGLSEPLLQAWMNEHIAPEQRATVLSVRAMCFTLGGGAGLACLGLVARGAGIPAAWFISASLLLLVAPGYFVLGRRVQRIAAPLTADAISAPPKASPATLR